MNFLLWLGAIGGCSVLIAYSYKEISILTLIHLLGEIVIG